MKHHLISLFALLLLATSCSKKLDNVPFNDNPYDNDYTGSKVVRINTIETASIIIDTLFHLQNQIYYTKSYDTYDGVKLYRNGVLINTHYNSISHTVYIPDNTPVSGVTYTYEVRLFLGSGEASSDPFTYTTP